MNEKSVTVIGSGIVGLACAHYLSRAGWRVTVLDRGKPCEAASHANCGLIAPSHVLPLAEPGVVGKTLRSMFRPDSPFRVKPRFDPALWKWFLQFSRRCDRRRMLADAEGIHALLQSSRKLYGELLDEAPEIDCEWSSRGCLFVHRSRATFEAFAATEAMIREKFGVGAERLEGRALCEFEPAIKPDAAAGAWLYREDCHLRPDKLVEGWKRRLAAGGVRFNEPRELQGFERNGRLAVAPRGSGPIETTDAYVVATGAWTPFLNRALGLRVPIQPGKGYSITMPRPTTCPAVPMIFQAEKVAVTPMASAYRLGSTMEFAGYDNSLNPARLRALRRAAERYLREPLSEPVLEEWSGWRPMTWLMLRIKALLISLSGVRFRIFWRMASLYCNTSL